MPLSTSLKKRFYSYLYIQKKRARTWRVVALVLFVQLLCFYSSQAKAATKVVESDMFAPVASALTEVYFQECQLALDVGWSRRAECAELEVPLDYSKPEGKSIRLSIVRIPARQSRAELDPMLMLAGGPGQAASEGYLFADHRYNKLAASRDLYLIDQRGTGRSNALRCPSDEYDLPSAHDFEQVKQLLVSV